MKYSLQKKLSILLLSVTSVLFGIGNAEAQTFNNNGNLSVPASGVDSIKVECYGGGGGGGGVNTGNPSGAGGGGGGSYAATTFSSSYGNALDPGSYTITIGASGSAGGSSNGTGGTGGTTSFGTGASLVSAIGGSGGVGGANGAGGAGGVLGTGQTTIAGSNGNAGVNASGGAGGTAAGPSGGNGGAAQTGNGAGNGGTAPGGGGGGARRTSGNRAGGSGGKGRAIVTIYYTPCTGAPDAGTISTVAGSSVCPNQNFTISSNAVNNAGNISYQWYKSPAGANTFTAITGATNLSYAASNQTAATDYKFVAKCTVTNDSTTSNILTINLNPAYQCICETDGGDPFYENVGNVQLGSFSNSTSDDDNGYHNYQSLGSIGDVVTTLSYSFNITIGGDPYPQDHVYIYLDANHDGQVPAGEIIGSGVYDDNATVTINCTIPSTALAGLTALRVKVIDGTGQNGCQASFGGGEVEDYIVNVVTADACSGTPVAGTASGLSSICPSASFNLSVSGSTIGLGLTYQWQKSPTGANTWTNVTSGTSTSISTSQTAATDYRMYVVCTNSNESDTSNVITVGMNAANICNVCTPNFEYQDDYIQNVNFAGINQSSGASSNGFIAYNSTTGNVTPLVASDLSVTFFNGCDDDNLYAFIDWNQNGTLNDAGEVYTLATEDPECYETVTKTLNIVPPGNAIAGLTKMRIMVSSTYNDNEGIADPCTDDYSGEAEDYLLNVAALSPCSGTPDAGTISAAALACPSQNFTINSTGATVASGMTFNWQKSPPGANTWTNIISGNSTNISTSQTAATDYRMYVVCNNSNESDTSNVITVGMNAVNICNLCTPTSGGSSINYITQVTTTGGITNINQSSSSSAYTDYSATQIVTTAPNTSVNFSVLTGGASNTLITIWVDWNQNGIFGDITNEKVYTTSGGGNSSGTPFTGMIQVPIDATPGDTRMRIRSDWYLDGAPTNPCNLTDYGESEDYSVRVCNAITPVVSITPPSYCGITDGSLTISGLEANTQYSINYSFEGNAQAAISALADASGNITIGNIASGSYTNIIFSAPTTCTTQPVSATVAQGPIPALITDSSDVTACGITDGSITIGGLQSGNTYTLTYNYGVNPVSESHTVDASSGNIVLAGLPGGNYTQFSLSDGTCSVDNFGSVTISAPVQPQITLGNFEDNTDCTTPDGSFKLNSGDFVSGTAYDIYYNNAQHGTATANGAQQITIGGLVGGAYSNVYVVTPQGCVSDTADGNDITPGIQDVIVGGIPASMSISSVQTYPPSACNTPDGAMALYGVFPSSGFVNVYYRKDGIADMGTGVTSEAGDSLIVTDLAAGTYDSISVSDQISTQCPSNQMGGSYVIDNLSGDADLATTTSTGTNSQGNNSEVDYLNNDCELIAHIQATNGSLGAVTAHVDLLGSVGTYNSEYYIGRIYDLHADDNVGGEVTLYYTDDEVSAYNTAVGTDNATFPPIMEDGSNMMVTAFHSTAGSGSGPNGYDTTTAQLLTPVAVTHNTAEARYEVTIATSAFSGFFANSNPDAALPIRMGNISATNIGAANRVDWDTKEEKAGDRFEIERSRDAKGFTKTGETDAKGISGSKYSFVDAQPFTGINYYRLHILNNDGSSYYSKVVNATVAGRSLVIEAYPNPVSDQLTVKADGMVTGKGELVLTDATGRMIAKAGIESNGYAKFDMKALAQGIYLIKFVDDSSSQTIKVNKK